MYGDSEYPIRIQIGPRLGPGSGWADLKTDLWCPPEQNSRKWTSYSYSPSNFDLETFLSLSHSITKLCFLGGGVKLSIPEGNLCFYQQQVLVTHVWGL